MKNSDFRVQTRRAKSKFFALARDARVRQSAHYFVGNLQNNRPPTITIDNAMGSLRIALAARAQAIGKTVLLKDVDL